MSGENVSWSDKVAAAGDEASRRALLAQIGAWRATRLSDVVAQRHAADAMARLHNALGDNAAAEREARSLVSLCQTHPKAQAGELRRAQGLLRHVGGGKAVVGPRDGGRKERRGSKRRDERRDGKSRDGSKQRDAGKGRSGSKARGGSRKGERVAEAMKLARAGRWDDANQALAGGRGPSTQLARTWIRLAWALSAPDDAARVAGAREVEAWLAEQLAGRAEKAAPAAEKSARADKPARAEKAERAEKAAAKAPAEPLPPHALDELLGEQAPRRWRDRLKLIEAAAAAQPERLDELASLALDHHVAISGERSPAPWLANLTSSALAQGGTSTRQRVDDLLARGVFAASLYAETPFAALVELRRALEGAGHEVSSVRRGVLSRDEPIDRRVWTLRGVVNGTEILFAEAPASDEAWPGDLAQRIGARLPELCPQVALFAPGAGNAALRDAAAKAGVRVVESSDAAERLAALAELKPASTEAPANSASAVGDALSGLLAEGVPEAEALDAANNAFRRAYQAFRVARPVLDARTDDQADAARAAFLQSIDRVAPEHVRVPEGASWAVQLATRGVETGLLSDSSRFGGPGVGVVIDVAKALAAAGVEVGRVHHGVSRRELRNDEILTTLESDFPGLWRLEAGEVEVAVLAELAPESRVAATRLLLDDKARVVVVPVQGDMLSWWRSVGGADPIGWTGDEAADVAAAVKAL